MRFGIGMYSTQKPAGSEYSHPELYADMLRQARLAEKVGLDIDDAEVFDGLELGNTKPEDAATQIQQLVQAVLDKDPA